MLAELCDRCIRGIPFLSRWYFGKAAKIKRGYCLWMYRLGLLRPFSFVEWLVTYQCNFSCPYCEASAGKAAPNELNTEEGKALIDELCKTGVERLLLSGGEPLMRPDVIELMRYATQKKLSLGLVTNGYFVEKLWPQLKNFSYFLYFTSIDGMPAYHDKLRAAGSFESAMKGLELFKTLKVPTRMVNTVVHPKNLDQLEGLLGLLKKSGANVWHLTPAVAVGRAAQDKGFTLNGAELKRLVEFITKNRKVMRIGLGEARAYLACFSENPLDKPFFCGAGLTRCNIMPDGEVLPCQQVYDNAFSEGNVRTTPFSKIWKKGFKKIRERVLRDECQGCIYLDACQGGCWAEMVKQGACLKAVWEKSD